MSNQEEQLDLAAPEEGQEEDMGGDKCDEHGWYTGDKCPKCAERAAAERPGPPPEKPKKQAKPKAKPETVVVDTVEKQVPAPQHSQLPPEKNLPARKDEGQQQIVPRQGLAAIEISKSGPVLRSMDQARALCITIAKSPGMIPRHYMIRGKGDQPDTVDVEGMFVAMWHGMSLGLNPFQAIQNIAPINGMPCMFGDAPLALIRESGLLEDYKMEMGHINDAGMFEPCEAVTYGGLDDYPDSFAYRCTMKRKGNESPITRIVSVGMAKQAGWWNKRGYNNKATPWVYVPWRMLEARARGFVARDGFSDILGGLGIAEIQSDVVEAKVTVADAPAETEGRKPFGFSRE